MSLEMLMLAIGCFLVGTMLAQYLRIFALGPLSVLACVFAARGHLTGSLILDCGLVVVCLQLGYLVGALITIPQATSSDSKRDVMHFATRR
jgi:hypothetical protein